MLRGIFLILLTICNIINLQFQNVNIEDHMVYTKLFQTNFNFQKHIMNIRNATHYTLFWSKADNILNNFSVHVQKPLYIIQICN